MITLIIEGKKKRNDNNHDLIQNDMIRYYNDFTWIIKYPKTNANKATKITVEVGYRVVIMGWAGELDAVTFSCCTPSFGSTWRWCKDEIWFL